MHVRLGFLSTYPPTPCGIATFSAALARHLAAAGADVGVVRTVDGPHPFDAPVVHQWVTGRVGGAARAAAALNQFDLAVVQHEYGIFGGDDGEDVLDVLDLLHVPVITVLHTVLTHPTPNQHRVLEALIEHSAALVTMTQTARDRLVQGWGLDEDDVTVIAHGAESGPTLEIAPQPRAEVPTGPVVLTWGLLSEGKGIEWALEALAQLKGRGLNPTYLIVGQTHPRVLEREGEAYRERLVALTERLGLTENVRFDSRYLSVPDLQDVIRSADIVLLPYDSREQVTSGVLTEAVAAGKPVVSTAFPHAVELLADGAGVLVPQGDANAIADALERLLTEDGLADEAASIACGMAASLLWPAIATQYLGLAMSIRHLAAKAV